MRWIPFLGLSLILACSKSFPVVQVDFENKEILREGTIVYKADELVPGRTQETPNGKMIWPEFVRFRTGNQWGILRIVSAGNFYRFVSEPRFEQVAKFSDNLAGVRVNGRWGFVDTSGGLAIECLYDTLPPVMVSTKSGRSSDRTASWYYNFVDGAAWVCRDGVSFRIDPSGNPISHVRFEAVDLRKQEWLVPSFARFRLSAPQLLQLSKHSEEELARHKDKDVYVTSAKWNGKWGLIDRDENIFLQPSLDQSYDFRLFTDSLVWLKKDSTWGLWNRFVNDWGILPQYDRVEVCHKIAWVSQKDDQGIIDSLGHLAIPPGEVNHLQWGGRMPEKINGKWGY